jgi:spore cortex formation protein SpoVR/YcgB (stage V sporulation)
MACNKISFPFIFLHGSFRCTNCSNVMTNVSVHKFLDHAGRDLAAMEKENEGNCIKFIEHYKKWLSPNHYYIMLKAKTCKELIDLIERVAPNESRILGLIRFEIHSAYAEIGRRAIQVKDSNCRSMLELSLEHCCEAIRLLCNEPESLPEGSICKQARANSSSLLTLIGGMVAATL